MANMGKLAPNEPQLSTSAKVPVDTTKDYYEDLLKTVDSVTIDWDKSVGMYEKLPCVDFNLRTVKFFKEGKGDCPNIPLVGLATVLFLTPMNNFVHVCSLAASGDNASGVIGFGAEDPVKAGPYWKGDLELTEVSGEAGGGKYPLFAEIGIRMNKYYNGSGTAALLASIADTVYPGDAVKAHETLVYIMRSIFTRFSAKAAVQYLTTLRGAFLKKAVETCVYDEATDVVTLNVTSGFARFFKKWKQKIEVYTPWLVAEVVKAWAEQISTEGKFVEISDHRFQHIDEHGLYALVQKWTGRRVVRIKNTDEGLDEDVEDSGDADLTPDDTDIGEKPDIALVFDEGDNEIVWEPPEVKDKAEGCALLENNGSPIGVAAEIGLAQQSKGKFLEMFTNYIDWSEKKRKRELAMEEVVPNLSDELAKMQCVVTIPKSDTNAHEKELAAAAESVIDKWWEDEGEALATLIGDDPHAVSYFSGSVEYIIDRRKWEPGVIPTLETILHEDPDVEDKWMRGLAVGKDLWNNLCAIRPVVEVVCLPLADLRPDRAAQSTRKTFTSFECTSLTTAEVGGYFNIRAVADLFSTEHKHCVEEYKKRAEQYMIFSALMGTSKSNWYWLLLLLIIPIVVLAIAIASADDDK